MKLRNRKTGKIIPIEIHHIGGKNYETLAEINEDWEDYEDERQYTISDDGEVVPYAVDYIEEGTDKGRKSIGNYFKTKEEAEKAVEKLKAWKRLRDRYGFAFNGKLTDSKGKFYGVRVKYDNEAVTMKEARQAEHDVAILFGGEE